MKLQITIDGKAYEVDVEVLEDEEPQQTSPFASHPAPAVASGGSHVPSHSGAWDSNGKTARSPLMGLVIKVNVTTGQQVNAGDVLLVLEAMKMETNIAAPHAGIVKSIHVAEGDSVKQNQILVELA